jgi:hypothetical protein
MELEEKVAKYKELGTQIAELEKEKKLLATEILQYIPKEKKSIQVAGSSVKRVRRLSIKTSLEAAKLYDAVKIEEVVDKEKIKLLYEQGEEIPDVSEIEYIQVSSGAASDDNRR